MTEQENMPQPEDPEDPDTVDSKDLPTQQIENTFAPGEAPPGLEPGNIVLYVAGKPQPVQVSGAKQIVLGRGDTNLSGEEQFLDLSDVSGEIMGVSRRHATISQSTKGLFVEDLVSTNGTMLNDTKMTPMRKHPLNSGDTITLGQLRVTIYFLDNANADVVHLKLAPRLSPRQASGSISEAIPMTVFMTQITPLFHAIARLQDIIGEKGTPGLALTSIALTDETASEEGVLVEMVGLGDTSRELLRDIESIRLARRSDITSLWIKANSPFTDLATLAQAAQDAPLPAQANSIADYTKRKLSDSYDIEWTDKAEIMLIVLLFSPFSVIESNSDNPSTRILQ